MWKRKEIRHQYQAGTLENDEEFIAGTEVALCYLQLPFSPQCPDCKINNFKLFPLFHSPA